MRHRKPSWHQRALLLMLIAVGGAVVGHVGSQLLARFLSARAPVQGPTYSSAKRGDSAPLSGASSSAERLREIDTHLRNRDFGTALLLCDEAQGLFPGDRELLGRRQRAEDELHNRFRYQMFEQAAARRHYAAALALFNEIPADSAYKLRAAQALASVRSHFISEWLATAETAARLGQCNEARLYAAEILSIDGANVAARAVMAECSSQRQAAGGRSD